MFFSTWLKRFFASAMSSCSPGAQMLSPTGSRRFRVATMRLVCIVYLSPFLFIFFLSWSETIPWGKVKHQKTCTEGPFKCNVMFFLLQMWIPPHPAIHMSIPLTSYTLCLWWGRTYCWFHSAPQSSALLSWSSADDNMTLIITESVWCELYHFRKQANYSINA